VEGTRYKKRRKSREKCENKDLFYSQKGDELLLERNVLQEVVKINSNWVAKGLKLAPSVGNF
jgi:hypothetical protein